MSVRRLRGRSRPRRVTGLSVLLAGLSWDWSESERDVIHDLVVFLEPRRALTAPYYLEVASEVVESVLTMRDGMTETLQRLPEKAKAAAVVRAMRDACTDFVTIAGRETWVTPMFTLELGRMRGRVGEALGLLVDEFDLEVQGPLAAVLPGRASSEG